MWKILKYPSVLKKGHFLMVIYWLHICTLESCKILFLSFTFKWVLSWWIVQQKHKSWNWIHKFSFTWRTINLSCVVLGKHLQQRKLFYVYSRLGAWLYEEYTIFVYTLYFIILMFISIKLFINSSFQENSYLYTQNSNLEYYVPLLTLSLSYCIIWLSYHSSVLCTSGTVAKEGG